MIATTTVISLFGVFGEMAAVEEYENPTVDIFCEQISVKRKPAVLRNLDIGEGWKTWTPEYLASAIGSVPVKLHVCPVSQMNFLKKNFLYK